MKIHIFVEGPSEKAFLDGWVPRIAKGCEYSIYPHEGKGRLPQDAQVQPDRSNRSLLHQLPAKLRAFAKTLDPRTEGVLVLVDADTDDCVALKRSIVDVAMQCAPTIPTIVRIAVEETEAFFLGDLKALKAAYPGADIDRAMAFEPDSRPDKGTWELFGAIIGDDGAHKTEWAETMGRLVTTSASKSRSPSFKALCSALKRLSAERPTSLKKKRNYRHLAKTKKK